MNPASHLYGCNGRERPTGAKLVVQDGYHEFRENGVVVRRAKYIEIDTAPAPICFPGSFNDPACAGCAHRKVKEA